MRRAGRSFSRSFGVYKGGVAPVLDATPVWQSPAAGSLGSIAGGATFTQQFAASSPTGNPLTYVLQPGSLPAGASMTSAGLLSVPTTNPAADTLYSFVVRATDGSAYADRAFNLTVTHASFLDPYNASVSGLFHLDGNLTDAAAKHTFTSNQITFSSTTSKFGSSAYFLNSSPGSMTISTGTDLTMTGDFTLEFWFMSDTAHQQGWSVVMNGTFGEWNNYQDTSGAGGGVAVNAKTMAVNGPASAHVANLKVTNDGQWHHIALTRTGTSVVLWVDGVGGTAVTNSSTWDFSGAKFGGAGATDNSLSGWVDEIRFTKGVGRYTSSFTPPAAAFAYP